MVWHSNYVELYLCIPVYLQHLLMSITSWHCIVMGITTAVFHSSSGRPSASSSSSFISSSSSSSSTSTAMHLMESITFPGRATKYNTSYIDWVRFDTFTLVSLQVSLWLHSTVTLLVSWHQVWLDTTYMNLIPTTLKRSLLLLQKVVAQDRFNCSVHIGVIRESSSYPVITYLYDWYISVVSNRIW